MTFANTLRPVGQGVVTGCLSKSSPLTLTSINRKAADDLWHATLLVLLLSACFGAIATWSFGSEREDFRDVPTSMATQFMMMFGGDLSPALSA